MKVAYFDCFSGAAGDMMIGSLVDSGLDPEDLKRTISMLGLSDFEIEYFKVKKNGISGTKATVLVKSNSSHRHLSEIINLIDGSGLPRIIKQQSRSVFETLAHAEAKIHGLNVNQVHFHEVGAMDAIIDIVGTVSALSLLDIEEVYSSPINVGAGLLTCAHGLMPVPAPASLELLKGRPIYSSGTSAELITPTGAALLSTLSKGFRPFAPLKVEKIGYGAGDSDHELPNLLRVTIGESLNEG